MPHDDSKYRDSRDTDDNDKGVVFAENLYAHLVAELLGKNLAGYKLVPSPKGTFAGHEAYKLKRGLYYAIENTGEIVKVSGLATDVLLWRELTTSDIPAFNRAVRSIELPAEYAGNKYAVMAWADLTNSLVNEKKLRTTKLYNLAQSHLAGDCASFKPLSLTGQSLGHKVAPQASWFTPDLLEFPARDLLTLLPDAEAEMLMLGLGRAVCGASGETLVEVGSLSFSWVHLLILVGGAGVGKSFILNNVLWALDACGYQTTTYKANKKSSFNGRKSALADLVVTDDLTPEAQLALITHPDFKSLVSNGVMEVEDKGVDSYSARARSCFIACSNDYEPSDYLKIDEGAKRRLNYLHTYEVSNLPRYWGDKYPDARVGYHWEALGKRYRCDNITLALYLLYRSAELFLDTIGYQAQDGTVTKVKDSSLIEVTSTLRNGYAIATDLTHVRDLVAFYYRCVCFGIALASPRSRKRYLKAVSVEGLGFSPELLMYLLKYKVTTTNGVRTWLHNRGLTGLDFDTLDKGAHKPLSRHIDYLVKPRPAPLTPVEIMSELTQVMRSTCGNDMRYPRSVSAYSKTLKPLLVDCEEVVQSYIAAMDAHDLCEVDIGSRFPVEVRHALEAFLSDTLWLSSISAVED